MSDTPYFEKHVFFCMNQRDDGRSSCGEHGAAGAQKHAKRRIKELGLSGCGKVRINQAGCLDRCEEGRSQRLGMNMDSARCQLARHCARHGRTYRKR